MKNIPEMPINLGNHTVCRLLAQPGVPFMFWYAIAPLPDGHGQVITSFDIRDLPASYKATHQEYDLSSLKQFSISECRSRRQHLGAISEAIRDKFEFERIANLAPRSSFPYNKFRTMA